MEAFRKNEWLILLAFALCSACLLAPQHAGGRVLPQADLAYHLHWAQGFADALASGSWYPRWLPDEKLGLGDPTFLYYPPLYYYAVAAVLPIAGTVWHSMRMVEWAACTLAAWIIYTLCHSLCGPRLGFVAGLALLASPMLIGLVYSFNARPWFVSSAAAAFLLSSAWAPPRRLLDVRLAAATALMAATHVLAAFAMLLCLPFLYIFESAPGGRLLRYAISTGAGLALAAAYLLPALANLDLVTPVAWREGVLDWHGAFAFPAFASRVFPVRWFGYQWVVPAALLAAAAVAAACLRRSGGSRDPEWRRLAGGVAACAAALFLASEASYPLWAILPPLQKVQFPYRFLFVCAIILPAVLAPLLARCARLSCPVRWRLALWAGLAIPVACSALILWRTLPDTSSIRSFQERLAGKPHAGAPEYLPAVAGPRWRDWALQGALRSEASLRGVSVHSETRSSHLYRWRFSADAPALLRLPVFAFPSWKLTVNGTPQPCNADPETGLVQVRLPSGLSEARLEWTGAPWERAGFGISALAAFLLVSASAWRRCSRP